MRTANVLGIRVDGWERDALLDAVVTWSSDPDRQKRSILYANVHVLNSAYRSAALATAMRSATTVYCDGSGARLGASLLGQSLPERMTGADWIAPLSRRLAASGSSIFILAGEDGVAERAAGVLRKEQPGLRIAGVHHGFVTPNDDEALTATINSSGAALVFVGMGTPAQETWIERNRAALNAPVVWAVGALFDFVAGVERRGPEWMRRNHLEWLARLAANPGRHWRRYLVGNPLFVARVLSQRFSRAARPTRD